MLKLRFKKYGRKGQPSYRIVAMDSRTKRDGRTIEQLGYYDPLTKKTHLKITPIKKYLANGAQITDSVKNLFVKANILSKEV